MRRTVALLFLLMLGSYVSSQEPVSPGFRDDFLGEVKEAWTILNHNPDNISFEKKEDFLTITTEAGGIWRSFDSARNILLLDMLPDTNDFVMTTRLVNFDPQVRYQQAGLICLDDVDNYLKFVFEFDPGNGGRTLAVTPELEGIDHANSFLKVNQTIDDLWLRIVKSDQAYICAASRDGGKTFRTVSVLNWKDGLPLKVGLIAKNGAPKATPAVDASFDFFEIVSLESKPDLLPWVKEQTEY